MANDDIRYCVCDLVEYATAGCDGDKPVTIVTGLVEADLLGHTTHGLLAVQRGFPESR